PIIGDVNADVYACDIDRNGACTPADDDPASRPDVPGHGRTCRVDASIQGLDLVPSQNPDGTVNLTISMQMQVNTGLIPFKLATPICNMDCTVEFDSDRNAPPYVPFRVI